MPTIEIKWFDGRSQEQKASVAKAITDIIVDIGKTKLWINARGEHVQPQWHQINIAGALAIAK